jgi:Asp-tRNA(Asn)/Glu-tRNA(Gln) amidotransferase C subunit
MRFFSRNKSNADLEKMRDMDNSLQKMNNQLKHIEQLIEQISAKSPQIIIENVHIHQPVLEKMEYRLDKLDIEQLSGSLNLGNNFGTKMNAGVDQKKSPSPAGRSDNASNPVIHHTASGFRVRKS